MKSRALWAVVITAVSSGLIAGCGVDPEQWVQYFTSTPGKARITFTDDRQSVFVMSPSGTEVTRIGAGSDPSIALDGSKIVVGGSSIATMDPDGSHVSKLADGGYQPTFSPDARFIAFVRAGAIYRVNNDGHQLRQLTTAPGNIVGPDRISAQNPSYSRDGKQILFIRADAIWMMASDGTGQRQLLADQYDNSEPVFTMDGAGIVFTSNRGGKNRSEIYEMDVNGRHIRPLTDDWTGHPSFSADGSTIVFTRFTRDATSKPGAEIWSMYGDGTHQHRLTDPKIIAQHPSSGGGENM
ncbi:TolB family protein [Nocardia sp. GAS34]|uniref:TolB family protein n=1 Tax=unclassified Nocardia TaxID=2637762 RepID=UPI003D1EFECF